MGGEAKTPGTNQPLSPSGVPVSCLFFSECECFILELNNTEHK